MLEAEDSSMDLLDLLNKSGDQQSLGTLSSELGLDDSAGGSLDSSLSDVFSGLTDRGFDIDDVAGLAKKFF